MRLSRSWWAVVSVLAAAAALAAVIVVVVISGRTKLHIDVTGLPEGTVTRIVVSGPSSYEFTGKSDDRQVSPGRYTIRTSAVPTDLGLAYTATDESTVEVGEGQSVTWVADYLVVIPESTKVLDFTNPGILAVTNEVVTFAPGSPSLPLAPGSIFVVAEGPQTPSPLARRVESVANTQDGVVVRARPVPLVEALPAARFLFDDTAAQAVQFQRVALSERARDPMFTVHLFPDPGGDRGCQTQDFADVKLDVYSLRPKLSGDVGWKAFPPSVDLSFEASLNPEVAFATQFRSGVECAWERSADIPLKRLCGSALTKLARIGPVSLKCEVEPHVKAGIQAKVATDVSIDMELYLGSDGLRATSGDVKSSTNPEIQGEAAASLELGLDIALKGGDPSGTLWLGIELETGLGPEYEVKAPPLEQRVNVVLRLEVEAKMELDFRFRDWEEEMVILTVESKIPVWQREGTGPSTAPSSRGTSDPFANTDWLSILRPMGVCAIGPDAGWGGPRDVAIIDTRKGDLTGDGVIDTVVHYTCTGVNHAGSGLEIFSGSPSPTPRSIGAVGTDDRRSMVKLPDDNAIRGATAEIAADGTLSISGIAYMEVNGSFPPLCCPNTYYEASLSWDGQRFLQSSLKYWICDDVLRAESNGQIKSQCQRRDGVG